MGGRPRQPRVRCGALDRVRERSARRAQRAPDVAQADQTLPPSEISADLLAALPDVLAQLEQALLPQWEQLQTIQPVNAVNQFGSDLKTLGERYQLALLADYGTKLSTAIEYFDVTTMRMTLREFPSLIRKLKSLECKTQQIERF